jgi:LysR family transcriptional regulator for metE and metH
MILAEFAKTNPAVDVQIVSDATLSPERALLEGKIDLGIINRPGDDQRLCYFPLFEDEMVVITAPDHPFVHRAFVGAVDLADEHFITYAVPPGHGLISQAVLRPAGVRPRRVTEVQWTEAIVEFVKAGMGVSVIATWAVESHIRDGSLRAIRLTESGFRRRWNAAVLANTEVPLHLRSFMALLARGPVSAGRVTLSKARQKKTS